MKVNKTEIKEVKINIKELNHFKSRIENRDLLNEDYDVMKLTIETVIELSELINKKDMTINKLRFMLFGYPTEKSKNIFKRDFKKNKVKSADMNKKAGHGRLGASAYTGAQTFIYDHDELETGCTCGKCRQGKLYPVKDPEIIIKLFGQAPIRGEKHKINKLRCNRCGKVYPVPTPEGLKGKKYDETVAAIITLLKYGSGLPFYRMAKLQETVGIPLPASTQWEVIERFADSIYPVYDELVREAAQGDLVHNDDTTNRILALSYKNEDHKKQDTPVRKGIFTTGIVSRSENYDIALFFTGNQHAGENLNNLLAKRGTELEKPLQMCDALPRNQAKDFKVILGNCLTHARRYFVDVYDNFYRKCGFVIRRLGKIYKYDEIACKKKMTPEERLKFHQKKSQPVMEELKEWLNRQFDQKLVEPNCGLGKAISYMLKHWDKLTMFLKVAGIPLDNNICERALKKVVLHRKNAYFFKTEHGAYVGDMFMSIIHTCNLMNVNPFHYLTTIHRHCSNAFKHPKNWMPWNYTLQLDSS